MAKKDEKDSEKKEEAAAEEKKDQEKKEEFDPKVVTEETFSEKTGRLPDEPVPESEKAKEKEEKEKAAAEETESKKKAEAAKKKEESATSEKKEKEEEELPEAKEDDPEGVKKRIDILTRKNHEKARRIGELEQKLDETDSDGKKWQEYARSQDKKRLEELESGKKEPEKEGEKEAEKEDPEPVYDEEKYEDFTDWVKDHTAWSVKHTIREEIKALRDDLKKDGEKAKTESEQAVVSKEVEAKLAKGREKYKDFDKVVGRELDLGPMNEAMMDSIYDSDMAADLAYHIASNPEEARRISSLSNPYSVAREIGKLEAKLSSSTEKSDAEKSSETEKSEESTETEKKPSEAPEPLESLGGRETAIKTLDSMSVDEYIATMNKKEAASGGF